MRPAAWLAALLVAGAAAPPPAAAQTPTPAAQAPGMQPCGVKAARYEGETGFGVFVTRLGRATLENPLRPLTPEVTQVLQVTIAGKPATAYGPDLSALRRGGALPALQAQLGAPVKWEPALPELPDPLAIVGEDGTPLAALRFRECTDAPAVKAAPEAARRDRKAAPRAARTAPKAPPGFSVPQGAIAE